MDAVLAKGGKDVGSHEFCQDVGVEGGIVPDAEAVGEVAEGGGRGGALRGLPGGE